MRWSDVQSEFYKSLCGEFTAWTDVKMKSLTCKFVEILWEFQARIQVSELKSNLWDFMRRFLE